MRAALAAAVASLVAVSALAELDDESCLLCHQYDGLAFSGAEGEPIHHFEVDPDLWLQSVHGGVACRDCHRDVQELPHGAVERVNCAVTCHVLDPSTNRPFTHAPEIGRFESSVHGAGRADDPYPEDRPTCLDCHQNRLFAAHEGAWGATDQLVQETLVRCRGCHQDPAWSEYVLSHVMHRMRRRRPPEEVVQLCTSCHEDVERMARHGLVPMWDFRDSFHWRMILLGDPDAPDCLSCHVPVGYSAHEIHHRDDLRSAINVENLRATCSNPGGAQRCHTGATQAFAEARIHFSDRRAFEIMQDESLDPDVRALLAQRIENQEAFMRADEFRFWILGLISLLYKVMIGAVIGGMMVHQILDFIAQLRLRRRKARARVGVGGDA
ncbi:hypothetical protein JXA47_02185 [Candidatus Sumerlaeota bacterium]|nr:hypothetical protein [Candidatus Sumerlaeota bacterium]